MAPGTQDLVGWRTGRQNPKQNSPPGHSYDCGVANAGKLGPLGPLGAAEQLVQFLLDDTFFPNLTAANRKNYLLYKNPTDRQDLPAFHRALKLHHIFKPSYFSQNPTKGPGTGVTQTRPRSKTLFQV